jgi:hypothetical protein
MPLRSSAGWATKRYAIEANDPALDIAKDCEKRFCKPLVGVAVTVGVGTDVHGRKLPVMYGHNTTAPVSVPN